MGRKPGPQRQCEDRQNIEQRQMCRAEQGKGTGGTEQVDKAEGRHAPHDPAVPRQQRAVAPGGQSRDAGDGRQGGP